MGRVTVVTNAKRGFQTVAQNSTFKKNVAAVHIRNVPLLQRKLHNSLMYFAIRSTPPEHGEYQVEIKVLVDLLGFHSKNLRYLKDTLSGLTRTNIEWNLFEDKEKDSEGCPQEIEWGTAALLASARIRGRYCYYSFSPPLERMLRTPALYTRLDLSIQRRFTSKYALALYENALRFINLGYTRWIGVELIRKILGINEDHSEFKYLSRLLKEACAEVNAKSDILVEPEYRREMRQVVAIRFLVERKEKTDAPGLASIAGKEQDDRKDLGASAGAMQILIANYGFAETEAKGLLKQYGLATVESAIASVEDRRKKGHVRWVKPYLLGVLKNAKLGRGAPAAKAASAARSKEEKVPSKAEQVELLNKQYSAYRTKELEKLLAEMPYDEVQQVDEEFAQQIKGTLQYSLYTKRGFNSPVVCAYYEEFLVNRLVARYPTLSREHFLSIQEQPQ
jgi:plasmid replication initiation protein